MYFSDALEALTQIKLRLPAEVDRMITDAVVDSRLANAGSLFVALPGEHLDGHEFINDAFKHQASLALAQRAPLEPDAAHLVLDLSTPIDPGKLQTLLNDLQPATRVCLVVPDSLAALQKIAASWRIKHAIRVIGVTGSVGKTSTKELVTQVLNQRYRTLKNQGNFNNEIGLPLTIISLNSSHQRAVLEMGFYKTGEIALLCQIAQPQVGVITNIGTVHAERAGSQEAIARGKAELVEALPPAPEGVAILNADDPWVRPMAEKTRAKVFYYGTEPEVDLWADQIEGLGLDGIRFRLHYQDEVIHVKAPLIGQHSVHTALRATAVGLVEGLTWQEIIAGLHEESGQLRLVAVQTPEGALVLDDTYNASPESTLAALNLLADLAKNNVRRRKIAVLGDMRELGPYERQGHEMVGARAAEVVDELVTVGNLGKVIAEAARSAGLSSRCITILENSDQAIEVLKPRLTEKDIVLVKGSRAMQLEKIITGLEAH